MINLTQIKKIWRKLWYFLWESDSIWSWIVDIILAFVIIKFIVYPLLGLILGTHLPIVAVVSSSMEHQQSFDNWWQNTGDYYQNINLSKAEFQHFSLSNGFNKGDLIILKGVDCQSSEVGDIIVFQARKPDPIIHRVIKKWPNNTNNLQCYYQTKGDNYQTNPQPLNNKLVNETRVSSQQVYGQALFRIPWLGWIKIVVVRIFQPAKGI